MLEQNDQLVRRLEKELLDTIHLQFSIFQRSQKTAISHLLKLLENLLCEMESGKFDYPRQTEQSITKTMIEAVEHCIRWVLGQRKKEISEIYCYWKQYDAEALDLLTWAFKYSRLDVDHTAWSRGAMNCLVDQDSKSITFSYPENDPNILLDQLESDDLHADDFYGSLPKNIDECFSMSCSGLFEEDNLYGLPTVAINRKSTAYRDALQWVEKTVLPEIPGTHELGGFKMNEFRQFYISLWMQCRYINQLEDATDQFRLLCGPKDYIIHWLSEHCRLPLNTILNILKCLTFEPAHRHPSLGGHPFVHTDDGFFILLPGLFTRMDPCVMLSTALNTGAKQRLYESIIEKIEMAAKHKLAMLLRDNGYFVWDKPFLEGSSLNPLTPDLIIAQSDSDWVAVIEYKHALPPQGAAGVSNRIKEASKWLEKARQYLSATQAQIEFVQARMEIPPKDRRVIVAIVSKWPMPVPIIIETENIYVTDVSAIERGIRQGKNIQDILRTKAKKSRPQMKQSHHDIHVGEWTYRHPILVPENGFEEPTH